MMRELLKTKNSLKFYKTRFVHKIYTYNIRIKTQNTPNNAHGIVGRFFVFSALPYLQNAAFFKT